MSVLRVVLVRLGHLYVGYLRSISRQGSTIGFDSKPHPLVRATILPYYTQYTQFIFE